MAVNALNSYKAAIREALDSTDFSPLEMMVGAIFSGVEAVAFCGNGGSAAIASHFAADFSKNAARTPHGTRYACLSDCVPFLTAVSNDVDYRQAYATILTATIPAGPKGMLVVVSSSGNSPNVLEAIDAARKRGNSVFTLTGFNENNAANLARTHGVYVPSKSYGAVEDTHSIALHAAILLTYDYAEKLKGSES